MNASPHSSRAVAKVKGEMEAAVKQLRFERTSVRLAVVLVLVSVSPYRFCGFSIRALQYIVATY
jgi:hypothetical protein